MCFHIHKECKKPLIAKEDITVWKSFKTTNFILNDDTDPYIIDNYDGFHVGSLLKRHSIGFISLHRYFQYLYGETYKLTNKQIEKFKKHRYDESGIWNHGEIDLGFHSHMTRTKAHGSSDYAIKCYIPNGSYYFFNKEELEYVSTSIRITDNRKDIKTEKS